MAARPEEALETLFLSMYSADELRRLIWRLPDGDQLSLALPGGSTSPAALAHEAVGVLVRKKLVNADLFNAMRAERGGRGAEISAVEKAFGAQSSASPAQTPTDQHATTDSNTTQSPTSRKILFLAANPLTTSRLALDQEFRGIAERLQMSAQRERFTLTSAWAVRTGDLRQQLLDQKPDIVHFAGHGTTDGLVLEGRSGGAQRASGAALTALFGLFKEHVRCVVLNACWSDEQATAIAAEIPVVIGMAGPVIDDAGVLFADGLYQGLGAGRSVEDAVQLGRVAYELEELGASAEPKIRVKSGIDLKTWRL